MFKKLFSLFSSKRRPHKKTTRKKRCVKKRTRRVSKKGMRGGLGQGVTTMFNNGAMTGG